MNSVSIKNFSKDDGSVPYKLCQTSSIQYWCDHTCGNLHGLAPPWLKDLVLLQLEWEVRSAKSKERCLPSLWVWVLQGPWAGLQKASWVIPVCCAPQPHRAQSPRLVRGSRSLPAFSISLVGEGSAARAKLADLEALRAQWNHIFILYSRSFDMKYQEGGSC